MPDLIDPATGEVCDAAARPDLAERAREAAGGLMLAESDMANAEALLKVARARAQGCRDLLLLMLPEGGDPLLFGDGALVIREPARKRPRRPDIEAIQRYAEDERLPPELMPTKQPCPTCKGQGWTPGFPKVSDIDEAREALYKKGLAPIQLLEVPDPPPDNIIIRYTADQETPF